jgi:hypothetical protein
MTMADSVNASGVSSLPEFALGSSYARSGRTIQGTLVPNTGTIANATTQLLLVANFIFSTGQSNS